MVLFFTAFMAAALAASPTVPLPSRVLPTFLIVLPDTQGLNFDLYDVRAELNLQVRHPEVPPHTIFAVRRHIGLAAGYDNGVVHGSLGLYLTVAQIGRWNLGVPSPEIGFGRYSELDKRTKQTLMKTESTVLISLASVHYRGGHIRSIGKDWYFTLEQVYDSRSNVTGSQFGFSFSNP
jgi:hypothetical protein